MVSVSLSESMNKSSEPYLVLHTGHPWQRWSSISWRQHTDSNQCLWCPGPGCGALTPTPSCGWWCVPAPGPQGHRSSASGWWVEGFLSLCSEAWPSGPGSGWCCWLAPGTPGKNLEGMKHSWNTQPGVEAAAFKQSSHFNPLWIQGQINEATTATALWQLSWRNFF